MDTNASGWGARVGRLVGNILAVYVFIAVVVAAPYHNWKYAQKNGFWGWLFLGQIVPTAQAFAWPYNLVSRRSSTSRETVEHFSASLTYWQAAIKIAADTKTVNAVKPTEAAALVGLFEKALSESRQVNIDELNQHYKGLGDEYQARFIAGMQSVVDSLKYRRIESMERGFVLLNSWADWFEPRSRTIYQ